MSIRMEVDSCPPHATDSSTLHERNPRDDIGPNVLPPVSTRRFGHPPISRMESGALRVVRDDGALGLPLPVHGVGLLRDDPDDDGHHFGRKPFAPPRQRNTRVHALFTRASVGEPEEIKARKMRCHVREQDRVQTLLPRDTPTKLPTRQRSFRHPNKASDASNEASDASNEASDAQIRLPTRQRSFRRAPRA